MKWLVCLIFPSLLAAAKPAPQLTYDFQTAHKLYELETYAQADRPGLVLSSYKAPAQAVVFCGTPEHGMRIGLHLFSTENKKRQIFFRIYDMDLGDMGEFKSDIFASRETCYEALNELLRTPQVRVRFDLESRKVIFDHIQPN